MRNEMTEQQRAAYIKALLKERQNPSSDHAAIDAELRRIGATAEIPVKRAAKRVSRVG